MRKRMNDGRHLVPLNRDDHEETCDPMRVVGWIVAEEDRAVRKLPVEREAETITPLGSQPC